MGMMHSRPGMGRDDEGLIPSRELQVLVSYTTGSPYVTQYRRPRRHSGEVREWCEKPSVVCTDQALPRFTVKGRAYEHLIDCYSCVDWAALNLPQSSIHCDLDMYC